MNLNTNRIFHKLQRDGRILIRCGREEGAELSFGFRIRLQTGEAYTEQDFAGAEARVLQKNEEVRSYAYCYRHPQMLATLQMDLYPQEGAVEWAIQLENLSSGPLELAEIVLAEGELASMGRTGINGPWRALNAGLQSTDMHAGIEVLEPGPSHYFDSFTLLHQPEGKGRSILLGCCSFESYFPHLLVQAEAGYERLHLSVANKLEQLILPSCSAVATEKAVMIMGDHDHDRLLRLYMERVCREMQPASGFRTPPTGWLSWYYYYGTVTEQHILENVQELRKFSHIAPEYVVIDAGWFLETGFGDWEPNSKFPHGMKWLAERITEAGYKPGLWFSPLLADAGSRLVSEHPDWLLTSNGLPVAGMNPNGSDVLELHEKNNIKFALDLTNPEVLEHLRWLFHRAVHEWGFRYIKLDFLVRSLFTDQGTHSSLEREQIYYPGTTTARAYRNAMKVIREAAGADCFILGCAAPLFTSMGNMIDANRMTPDITRRNYTVGQDRPSAWELVKLCARTMAARYFLHGTAGFNDPDVLVIRGHEPEGISDDYTPTLDEARVWAGVVALSGGLLFYNDKLSGLEEERRPIVSQLFPVGPGAAVPVDFFHPDAPELWKLAVEGPGGERRVILGLFNWEDHAKDMAVPLEAIGYPEGEELHGMELWTQEYISGINELRFHNVMPHSMRLLALRPSAGHPQLTGTDMHFTQGWAEFASEQWDQEQQTLELMWKPGYTRRGCIHLHLPQSYCHREADSNARLLGRVGSVMTLCQEEPGEALWVKFRAEPQEPQG
ncbi:MAG: alpha-galactosidase [Paenibacillaceae bacterium]|nr:alpha-galactosidase [Paenibacillaceae bacterium]